MDVLKTGDQFAVTTKQGDEYKYEFVGLDLQDTGSDGTGCQYIVLKNMENGTMTCVERLWFSEELTGRKIKRYGTNEEHVDTQIQMKEVAQAYLDICDCDCAGDDSVGIPSCPFYEWPDLDGPYLGYCRLKSYLQMKEDN